MPDDQLTDDELAKVRQAVHDHGMSKVAKALKIHISALGTVLAETGTARRGSVALVRINLGDLPAPKSAPGAA